MRNWIVRLIHRLQRPHNESQQCILCNKPLPRSSARGNTAAHQTCRDCYTTIILSAFELPNKPHCLLQWEAWYLLPGIVHDAVLHGAPEPRDLDELAAWLRRVVPRQEEMARQARRGLGGYFGGTAAVLAVALAMLEGRAAASWRA